MQGPGPYPGLLETLPLSIFVNYLTLNILGKCG